MQVMLQGGMHDDFSKRADLTCSCKGWERGARRPFYNSFIPEVGSVLDGEGTLPKPP